MVTKAELLDELEDLTEAEERKYQELEPLGVEKLTDKAALLALKADDVWFPFSQMRQLDGSLYVSDWILEQKGLA